MVPLRGDAFEGQAKSLALTGPQWRRAQVNRVGIRPVRLQHVKWNLLIADGLIHAVFEYHPHRRADYRFVAGIGDRTIDVRDSSANKIFRSAHLQVSKFEISGVWGWADRAFGFLAQAQHD